MPEDRSPVATGIVATVAIVTVIYSSVATVIAFVGGTLPIIGIELDGGIGTGLLFLFVIDPILMTVGWITALVLALPITLLTRRRSHDR
jgi:hypothetical protein